MRAIIVLPISFLAGLGIGYAFFQRTGSPLGANTEADHHGGIPHAANSRAADSSSTDEKAQRLLAAALRKGSQIDRYSEVYLAIQDLNAEDYRRLMLDVGAIKAMIEKLRDIGSPFDQDLAAGLIDRWLAVDPETVVTWMPRIFELIPKDAPGRNVMLDVMAKRRPEELLALVSSRKDSGERSGIISRALRNLASKDPAKARAWLDGCTDPGDRRVAEQALRLGTVDADPLRGVELANAADNRREGFDIIQTAAQSAAKMGPGMIRQLATMPAKSWMIASLLGEFAEQDPEVAVDIALRSLSDSDTNAQMFSLWPAFSALARQDTELAISKLDGLKGPQLGVAVSTIGSQWAMRDPIAALSWLAEKPERERTNPQRTGYRSSDSLLYTFSDWYGADSKAARTWADDLPAGETRDKVQTHLARVLGFRGDAAEAMQVLSQLGTAADPKTLSEVAGTWAWSDPNAAADWAIAQPTGPIQNRALAQVVGTWANYNPAAAQDWLAQFPPGEARDRSIAAYLMRGSSWAQGAAERTADFEAWFDLIDDPWQRALVARRSYWSRRDSDPEGAANWLTSLPNVDQGLIQMTVRYKDY